MVKYIKSWPIHLFLFPLLFILNHFFSIVVPEENYSKIGLATLIFNFLGAVIFCIAFAFFIYFVLSVKIEKTKSSILTAIVIIPFFFFDDFFLSTEEILVGIRLRWLLPSLLIFLIILCYLVIKSKRSLIGIQEALNVLSFSLSLYILITLIRSFDYFKPHSFNYEPLTFNSQLDNDPDIYLLVLDSYTSNKSLRDYFHFDNEKFNQELRHLGFSIPDNLPSVYNYTKYSIGSILNLNQLPKLDRYENNFGIDELIKKNSVAKSLKRRGYEIENLSLFDIDEKKRYYTLSLSNKGWFLDGLIQNSLLSEVLRNFQKQSLYDLHKDILNKFEILATTKHEKPKFIYAHIMAPHPPFVIDANGKRINFYSMQKNRENKHAYIEQVKGLNSMVVNKLNEIIQKSPNSICIVLGDHGYRFLGKGREDEGFTVFLAYKGPNNNDISLLKNSSEVFNLIFKNLKKERK